MTTVLGGPKLQLSHFSRRSLFIAILVVGALLFPPFSQAKVEDVACQTAGGVSIPGECLKGGRSIDPFNAEEASAP
jgi:hypothetical protein